MQNGHVRLIATGYLYSPWNGTLRVYTGEIYHRNRCDNGPGGYSYPERTYFLVKDKHNRVLKSFDCAENEGEIHNKLVWLRELDTRKAADIFIEYEETQIARLKMQIENHESLIQSLRNI